jgi:2-amino-4-hydroxy-6-hydroxymethyldihydropteridine diphosphokinase
MAEVLIALGGNLGDVRTRFDAAIPALCEAAPAQLIARSSDYLTPPWGDTAQPPYVNAVIAVQTATGPDDLLAVMQQVEARFGRDRSRETRWGPRTLDLDMLAYDDLQRDTPSLTLPHPRLAERAFVLVPLAEIAPDHPVGGLTARAALARLSADGIQRLPTRI